MKRMFVALDLPLGLRERIFSSPGFDKGKYSGISWVSPENMHLTLKFLGDVPEEKVKAISDALARIASHHRPVGVSYGGFGRFGRGGSAGAIWLGASDRSGKLAALAGDIEGSLEGLGFAREGRPFSPHLTVCRVREGSNLPSWEEIRPLFNDVREDVLHEGFSLYESELTPRGPIYTRAGWFGFKRD